MLMQRCPEKEGQRPAMVPLGVAEGAVQGNRTQRGYLRLHNAACQACGAYPDCVIHRMYESGLGNTKNLPPAADPICTGERFTFYNS